MGYLDILDEVEETAAPQAPPPKKGGLGISGKVKDAGKAAAGGFVSTFESLAEAGDWVGDKLGIEGETMSTAARNIREFREQNLAPQEDTIVNDIFSGLGSMSAFFIPGGTIARIPTLFKGARAAIEAGTAAAKWFEYAGIAASTGMEALAEAGSARREAMDKGKTEEEADSVATGVFFKNMALVGATNKLSGFFEAGTKGFKKAALTGFLFEGAQEAGQSAISQDEVDGSVDWKKAGYEGIIGGIVGGGTGGVVSLIDKKIKQKHDSIGNADADAAGSGTTQLQFDEALHKSDTDARIKKFNEEAHKSIQIDKEVARTKEEAEYHAKEQKQQEEAAFQVQQVAAEKNRVFLESVKDRDSLLETASKVIAPVEQGDLPSADKQLFRPLREAHKALSLGDLDSKEIEHIMYNLEDAGQKISDPHVGAVASRLYEELHDEHRKASAREAGERKAQEQKEESGIQKGKQVNRARLAVQEEEALRVAAAEKKFDEHALSVRKRLAQFGKSLPTAVAPTRSQNAEMDSEIAAGQAAMLGKREAEVSAQAKGEKLQEIGRNLPSTPEQGAPVVQPVNTAERDNGLQNDQFQYEQELRKRTLLEKVAAREKEQQAARLEKERAETRAKLKGAYGPKHSEVNTSTERGQGPKLYKDKDSAKRAIRKFHDPLTHRPVAVEGGFAVQKKSDAEVALKARYSRPVYRNARQYARDMQYQGSGPVSKPAPKYSGAAFALAELKRRNPGAEEAAKKAVAEFEKKKAAEQEPKKITPREELKARYNRERDQIVKSQEQAAKEAPPEKKRWTLQIIDHLKAASAEIKKAARVTVADSHEALPAHLQKQLEEDEGAKGSVKAMYDPQTKRIFVLGHNIKEGNLEETAQALAHELGHFSFHDLFGKHAVPLLNHVALKYSAEVTSHIKTYGYEDTLAERQRAGEEVLIDKYLEGSDTGLVKKVVDAFRALFRRMGLGPNVLTDTEISNIVKMMKENLVKGRVENKQQVKQTGNNALKARYSYGTLEKWAKKLTQHTEKMNLNPEEVLKDLPRIRSLGELLQTRPELLEESDEDSSPIRGNADYDWTLDMNTNCPLRFQYDANIKAIEKKLGRVMTGDELFGLGTLLERQGKIAPCTYCYVEAGRRNYNEALLRYDQMRIDTKTVLDAYPNMTQDEHRAAVRVVMDPSTGKSKKTSVGTTVAKNLYEEWKSTNGNMSKFSTRMFSDKAFREKELKRDPRLAQIIRNAHKYAASASKANLQKQYAAYAGEWLDKADDQFRPKNQNRAGWRWFSSTDAQVNHIVDYMQAIIDHSVVGDKVHCYTKQPWFVDIFGDTGIKINMSLAATGKGKNIQPRSTMSMDWEEAKRLRKKFKNAGTMLFATNDDQIRFALDSDWIDMCIPWHTSNMRKTQRESLDEVWKDYTKVQGEKWINPEDHKGEDAPHFKYFQHKNDKKTYLNLCERAGVYPRFPDFVDHPNYMKLITDTVKADQKQEIVKPKFNWTKAEQVIRDWQKAGGYTVEQTADDKIVKSMMESIKQNDPLQQNLKARYSRNAAQREKSEAGPVTDLAEEQEVDRATPEPMEEKARYSRRTSPPPEKTITAYKLVKIRKGEIYPLFVGADKPFVMNEWTDAEMGEGTGTGKVKSKLGPLAMRPGLHLGDLPIATHIGGRNPGDVKPTFRKADEVWVEAEVAADVDWQKEADSRAKKTKDGNVIPRTAEIKDQLPVDGFYRYKTNPNMKGSWIITGAMKINRILSDEEVASINKKAGVEDLPRLEPKARYSRTLTPEQEQVVKHIGFNDPTVKPDKPHLELKWWEKGITNMVDSMYPLKKLEKQLEKEGVHLNMSGYKSFSLMSNFSSILNSLLHVGRPQMENGWVITKPEAEGGVYTVVERLGEDADFFFKRMTAKSAQEMKDKGRENLFGMDKDSVDPKTGKLTKMLDDQHVIDTLMEMTGPAYEQNKELWDESEARLREINKSVLDFAEASGLIGKEQRQAWERDNYIPFNRVLEDNWSEGNTDEQIHAMFPKTGAPHIGTIHKLEGSKRNMGDPLMNLVNSYAFVMNESLKNMARTKSLTVAGAAGLLSESRPGAGKGTISIRANGEAVYYTVHDPMLYDALVSMDGMNRGKISDGITKFLGAPKNWLTFGVTVNPAFRVANFIRDTLQTAFMQSSFTPFVDSWKGLVHAWRKSPEFLEYVSTGGSFSGSYHMRDMVGRDKADTDKILSRLKGEKGNALVEAAKKGWGFWEKMGEASENAARMGSYLRNVNNGMSKPEAAYQAQDLLNFYRSGKWDTVQFLIRTVPFMNARLQGLYKLGNTAVDPETRKHFWIMSVLLGAASLMIHSWNDDEDWYKSLNDSDKMTYWHFNVPELGILRIPKPFEVGSIMGSIPEALVETLNGDRTGAELGKYLMNMVENTLVLNPTPQIAKPFMHQWANKDSFTGAPIVSLSEQKLEPKEQFGPRTSKAARLIGEATDTSPKRIDKALDDTFSYLSFLGKYITDIVIENATSFPVDPAKRLGDDYIFGTGRFIKDPDVPPNFSKQQERFYDALREVDTVQATIREYKKLGEKEKLAAYKEEHADELKVAKRLDRTQKLVGKINQQIKLVHMSQTLDAQEKRSRIDSLLSQRQLLFEKGIKDLF
jgi:hypothetical protein